MKFRCIEVQLAAGVLHHNVISIGITLLYTGRKGMCATNTLFCSSSFSLNGSCFRLFSIY